MKPLLLISILTFLLARSFAQSNNCNNTYVWDFCTEEGSREVTIAKNFTEDFEAELTRQNCVILQRRKFGNLAAQAENEKAIHTLKGSNPKIEQSLKDIKAESVVFGQISFNSYYDKYYIYISIEQLETKQILESYKFSILRKDADSDELRKKEVKSAIDSLLHSNLSSEKTGKIEKNLFNPISKSPVVLSPEDSYKLHIGNAHFQFSSENYEDALNHYEQALNFKPNDSLALDGIKVCKDSIFSVLTRQGDKYASEENYETAIQNYKKADIFKSDKITQNKIESYTQKWYNLLVWRADRRYVARDWNSAIGEFREALVIKPNDQYCSKQIENCYNRIYQEAIAEAERLYNEKEWEQSLQSYFSIHESFPDSLEVLRVFETFLKKKFITVPEINLQIIYKLGDAFFRLKQYKKAREIYKDGFKYKAEDRKCTLSVKLCNDEIYQHFFDSKWEFTLKVIYSENQFYLEPINKDEGDVLSQLGCKIVNTVTGQSCWTEIGKKREEGCSIVPYCDSDCEYAIMLITPMGGLVSAENTIKIPKNAGKLYSVEVRIKSK